MINPEEIVQIVESIWFSILDLAIQVDGAGNERIAAAGSRTFTGCVQFTGDFEGATTLDCTDEIARRVAAVMFEADPESLSTEEIQDALGELTNMIGGNIKPLLPGTSRLSLPSVVEGMDYTLIVPGSQVLCQVGFECEGQPILVTLVESQGKR